MDDGSIGAHHHLRARLLRTCTSSSNPAGPARRDDRFGWIASYLMNHDRFGARGDGAAVPARPIICSPRTRRRSPTRKPSGWNDYYGVGAGAVAGNRNASKQGLSACARYILARPNTLQ